jgi:quercetin dioxygenase-like cupin family protein
MRAKRLIAAAALTIAAIGLTLPLTSAQQAGVRRAELQRHVLSVPGREVAQVRVELGPGVAFGRHRHPGEEIVYVLEGSLWSTRSRAGRR